MWDTMSNSMSTIFFGSHVGHLVHLHVCHHVHLHVGRHVSHHVGHCNVVSTLCEVSETLTEWKSESMTNQRTDGLTKVGAKDTCVSKKIHLMMDYEVGRHLLTFNYRTKENIKGTN